MMQQLHSQLKRALALGLLACVPAVAQTPPPPVVLCEGDPPLGWEFCTCELVGMMYEWVCDDDWGGGVVVPPGDPFKRKVDLWFVLAGPWAGVNRFQNGQRNDTLLRSIDRNGDGITEEGERLLFSDPGHPVTVNWRILDLTLDEVSSSRTALFYSTRVQGLYSAIDSDGDGLATRQGETRIALGANSRRDVPGATTQVTMDYRDFLAIESTRDSLLRKIMAFEANDTCVYHLLDLNGDGDFSDPLERINLFNAAARTGGPVILPVRPGFVLNADVMTGTLPSCFDEQRGEAELGAIDFELVSLPGGPPIPTYYFASTLPLRSSSSKHGLIYRGVDRNADFDVNDRGETTLYYDPVLAAPISFPFEQILDIVALRDELYVLQSNGPLGPQGRKLPTCWRLEDLNQDGDALDSGEATLLFTSRRAGAAEMEIYPFTIPEPGAAAIRYGFSCDGRGGATGPQHTASGPPVIGGPLRLVLSLANAPANAPSALMMGLSRTSLFGQPLPVDLTNFGQAGCWLLQSADLLFPAMTNATGSTRLDFGTVPPDPLLDGLELYTQYFSLDPVNGSIAWSDGQRLRFSL